jgi:hypothetical protein
MQMRNSKQNSVTTTSSFTGAFEKIKQEKSLLVISINLVKFTQNKIYENSLNRRNRIHWKTALPILIGQGHDVICCVRDKKGFIRQNSKKYHCN